jgi:hypothetical protein
VARSPMTRCAADLVATGGRGHPGRDPGAQLENQGAASARQLLQAAAERCTRLERAGRIEREVIAAAGDAGLLILARDGDRTRLGPKSLGPVSRFVDHAPCPVLLVWPGARAGHRHHPAAASHRPHHR